jgi:hypothetical protein
VIAASRSDRGVWRSRGQLARRLDQHVDHDPLRRSQHDPIDELLVLNPTAVPAESRVLAVWSATAALPGPPGRNTQVGDAGDQQVIAESAHGSVASLGRAEGGDLAILDEIVVQSQDQVAVGRRPVVGIGMDDKDVAVQAEFLGVILPDVRVIPVKPGSGNRRRSVNSPSHRIGAWVS